MKSLVTPRARLALILAVVLGTAGSIACGSGKANTLPEGAIDPAKYLFDRGTQELNAKHWMKARQYFQQLYDNYPQSTYRPDAKLGLGDSLLGENSPGSLVLAANEFREFLTYFPTNSRADYAQYKLGLAHCAQMLRADRDQTETKDAIREMETFVERYPDSPLIEQGRKKLREARDRLSEHSYNVGYFYYRIKWYPGAIDRFKTVLEDDPEYTYRDAVYYYLAESLMQVNMKAEALPYFERIIKEFVRSDYLEKAKARVKELKGGTTG
jgi:outer membrane protein assembly factor BamD